MQWLVTHQFESVVSNMKLLDNHVIVLTEFP